MSKICMLNGELDYTIDEFGQDWTHDIFPIEIMTLTEWSMDDAGVTFDVCNLRVVEALIFDSEDDTKRLATPDECKLIAKFLHNS